MKTIRLLLALLLVSSVLVGQTREFSKDYFLQKSKKQKTTAWILLAGGTAMAVGGFAIFDSSWDSGSASTTDIAGIIGTVGFLTGLSSIPYFISAGKNKKTAMSITFDYKPIYLSGDNLVSTKAHPTLTLKIKL
ncbi:MULTISPECIES: hypothetical protein [unclassified Arenibacter]|jgi:drug/metabolite transporter (DMT)-like permease|uniref:hypothetical protein n=1 Tax=unclassified Arenibacter TaxID=2615047 RepID=UPI000E343F74|nr:MULTISPECIES: hypothetical protein [unclassified Arenibacter]MCM4164115.1 hypothetical protein [Arenibacter sp. A80]RFT55920.1 hypothetical protein D0S24_10965 [Arenibacter sp. P308M17]